MTEDARHKAARVHKRNGHTIRRIMLGVRAALSAVEAGDILCAKLILLRLTKEHPKGELMTTFWQTPVEPVPSEGEAHASSNSN